MLNWRGRRRGGQRSESSRVWFVCQWFAPEPVVVPVSIVRSLARRIMSISVITGVPNYPAGVVQSGYSAVRFTTEKLDGVTVERCPLFPSHDESPIGRAANYLSWAISATLRALTRVRRNDVVLVYASPATAALPALIARLLVGTPYVLMIQDLWPDSVVATGFINRGGVRRVVESVITRFVARLYRSASHIIAISPGMIAILHSRGVPREKLSLVYNWADEETFRPSLAEAGLRSTLGIRDDAFVAMYAGNLGPAQGLDAVIRAVGRVDCGRRTVLLLVGDGIAEQELRSLAGQVAAERVVFLPPVPPSRMPGLMAAADIQIVSLRDHPLFHFTMPSKVQSILASGLPVIACAPGDVRDVVLESGAGWVAAPGSVVELERCICEASKAGPDDLALRGKLGRKYYEQKMSEAVNADRLVAILDDAAHSTVSHR